MAEERAMFVIGNNFHPFSMQEMLVPFTAYQNAYEKDEERYLDLQNKADNFSYLADTLPEDSKARQIYEGYANDLRKYGEDFGRNGLSMSNRRGLLSMRRRYQGEIGRLDKADTALQEEIKRRQVLSANDPTTLYATDNLSIDDFLDRKKPNGYSVSGNKLYERGVQIGASDSSRIWSSPKVQQVNDYYQSLYQTSGRDPRVLAQWRADLSSIPELNDSLNSTLKEFGVTDNLTGNNFERARESVINGIINGSTYKRADNFQRDLSKMSASEQSEANYRAGSLALQKDELDWKKQEAQRQENWIYTHDEKGNRTGYNPIFGGSTTGIPDGFYQDPKDGQLKRTPKGYKPDPSSPTGLVKDNDDGSDGSDNSSKKNPTWDALSKLDKKNFRNNNGFDLDVGNNRYHYSYAGVVDQHGGKWYNNFLGEDAESDNHLGTGFGFTSSSNLVDWWGDYSMEDIDKGERTKIRPVAANEMAQLLIDANGNPTELGKHVSDQIASYKRKNNIPENAQLSYELIEVPYENGGARKGYAIAVRDNQ